MTNLVDPFEQPLDVKIEKAILAIKEYADYFGMNTPLPGFETNEGYQLCFSGGKDSVVIKALADMAGVKYNAVYSITTIDPPELVQFIKNEHPDVERVNYKEEGKVVNFFKKMETKGFPLRMRKWCCDLYKHNTGNAFLKIIGIRAEESAKRKNRWKILTRWSGRGGEKYCLCPILYWTEKDVWDFIKKYNIPYCSLYDEGFTRLGCIACVEASKKQREKELARWPHYEKMFRRSFKRMWKNKVGSINRDGNEWFGSRKFKNSDELFEWWVSNEASPEDLIEGHQQCTMGLF